MSDSLFERLKRFDNKRESFPGEHWLVLSAGLWLLTRREGAPLARFASIAAGAALVCRAASGRDGLAGWLAAKQLPAHPGKALRSSRLRSRERFAGVGPSWQTAPRVRVSAISEPVNKRTEAP